MPLPVDADAALVSAALGHLKHLDDPERHLVRDTPRVPRIPSGWVREILRALRATGAQVVLPETLTVAQDVRTPSSGECRAEGAAVGLGPSRGRRCRRQVARFRSTAPSRASAIKVHAGRQALARMTRTAQASAAGPARAGEGGRLGGGHPAVGRPERAERGHGTARAERQGPAEHDVRALRARGRVRGGSGRRHLAHQQEGVDGRRVCTSPSRVSAGVPTVRRELRGGRTPVLHGATAYSR